MQIAFPTSRSGTGSRSESRSEAPSNSLAAVRAYRDKLRERVQGVEARYSVGQITTQELLKAEVELDDAEIAAAANADERQAVRRRKVEHLREMTKAIAVVVNSGAQPHDELLAAEAALIKAEAELAAESASTSSRQETSNYQPSGTWAPSASGQTTILRPAEEFADRLRSAEATLNRLKSADAQSFRVREDPTGGDLAAKTKVKERAIAEAERKLDFAREEYSAQIRLLELEIHDASLALAAAEREVKSAEALHNKKILSQSELNEARRVCSAAESRQQRVQTLLDLYRKADPKNEPAASASESASDGKSSSTKSGERSREH